MAVNRHDDSGEVTDGWTWQDDDRAYEEMRPELLEKYEGQYVAMYHGEVMAVADSAPRAAREALEALGRPELLLVAKVGEPLPEPIDTDMSIDGPREVVIQ
ncbi:MAG: DUF5678 domain-containing protein [Armatimonadota bacterium]